MKIIYEKNKNSSISELKSRLHLCIECLMLTFVMCTFGILFAVSKINESDAVLENTRVAQQDFMSDSIELEFSASSEQEAEGEQKQSVFWESFEQYQKGNNG